MCFFTSDYQAEPYKTRDYFQLSCYGLVELCCRTIVPSLTRICTSKLVEFLFYRVMALTQAVLCRTQSPSPTKVPTPTHWSISSSKSPYSVSPSSSTSWDQFSSSVEAEVIFPWLWPVLAILTREVLSMLTRIASVVRLTFDFLMFGFL